MAAVAWQELTALAALIGGCSLALAALIGRGGGGAWGVVALAVLIGRLGHWVPPRLQIAALSAEPSWRWPAPTPWAPSWCRAVTQDLHQAQQVLGLGFQRLSSSPVSWFRRPGPPAGRRGRQLSTAAASAVPFLTSPPAPYTQAESPFWLPLLGTPGPPSRPVETRPQPQLGVLERTCARRPTRQEGKGVPIEGKCELSVSGWSMDGRPGRDGRLWLGMSTWKGGREFADLKVAEPLSVPESLGPRRCVCSKVSPALPSAAPACSCLPHPPLP